MNILWLSWRDIKNPAAGGAEKVAIEVAKRFVRDNSSVTIFTSSFEKAKSQEKVSGVNIIRRGNQLTCRLHAFLYYRKNPDFNVVIDEINTIPFFTNFYAKSKSIALIHQLARQYWFSNLPQPLSTIGFILENLYLMLYKDMLTITVSKSTEKDLKALGFKNIKIIREGLNFKPYTPTIKSNQLLFLGRLTKVKGPNQAILAYNLIHQKLPNYRLIIAGSGKYLKSLKKLVKNFKLTSKITFTGHVNETKKIKILRNSKIILIPSIREGWGLVAIEAMSQGCVPIAYNVPGLKDSIINNRTGILTEKTPETLADSAIKILTNNSLAGKLAKNGVEHSKKYSWDNTYLEVNKVLGDKFLKVSH